MVAGYVRLSRDDDKKNYISIENQKLLINQFASELGYVIDTWYEDDGISGYSFNRPGFKKLLDDLEHDIDTVIAKDLSRIGRHNAKVLLLLDDFKERGKRLLLVDDNYDTLAADDDIIGIKTWYNERYVKDTSRKIRKVIRAHQEKGTLLLRVPFGYVRDKNDKSRIVMIEEEAEYIRRIFELYLQGYGYRKIANILTEQGIPTPSMMINNRYLAEGKVLKYKITTVWTDGMVSEILKNDFYIGNFRTHKRARVTINGSDRRVSKGEQILFENNHEPIIDKNSFDLVQEIMKKRIHSNYRGQGSEGNIFAGCLFCKECGSRLTPIQRKNNTNQKYYLCNTYNQKGKRYCEYSHLINEADLAEDFINYIKLCRNVLAEIILTFNISDFINEKNPIKDKRRLLIDSLENNKNKLKVLLSQKINELAANARDVDIINESYSELMTEIIAKINNYDAQLQLLDNSRSDDSNPQGKLATALQVVDSIIDKGNINRKDIEILVDKIIVDQDGLPDIVLKYNLNKLAKYSPAAVLNKHEAEIILTTMKLIRQEDRTYTSAKHLSEELTKLGYNKYKKAVRPYIQIMINMGILNETKNRQRPHEILVSKDELSNRINLYMESMSNRWYASNGS